MYFIVKVDDHYVWIKCKLVNTQDSSCRKFPVMITAIGLKGSKLWWEGPEWLAKAKKNWPAYEHRDQRTPENLIEDRGQSLHCHLLRRLFNLIQNSG